MFGPRTLDYIILPHISKQIAVAQQWQVSYKISKMTVEMRVFLYVPAISITQSIGHDLQYSCYITI